MQSEQQQFLPLSVVMPLINPKYPPQYYQKFTQLKKLMMNKQFTSQTNKLAEQLIKYGQSNYNCWYVKKMCFLNQVVTYQHQLKFSEDTLFQKIKNFQVWEHRKFLSEHSQKYQDEYQLIGKILKLQLKNYHAWSYRIWIVDHVKDYLDQMQFTHELIKQDPYNNSVWSYRYHVFSKILQSTQSQQQKQKMIYVQIMQTLLQIEQNLNNQASWNYIRGFFPSIKLKDIPDSNKHIKIICESYKKYPRLLQFVKYQLDKLQKIMQDEKYQPIKYHYEAEVQLLIILVCIQSQSQDTTIYAKNTCLLLAQKQKQKQYYWKWLANNLKYQQKQ